MAKATSSLEATRVTLSCAVDELVGRETAPFRAVPGGEAGGRGPAAQSLLFPPLSGRGLRGAPKANVHCGGDGLQKEKKGKNRLWKVGCGGSQLGVVLRPVLPGDTGQCLKTFSVLTPGCYWHLGGGGQGCH